MYFVVHAVLFIALIAGSFAYPALAFAQSAYPDKPIRLIANVPIAETVARLLAPKLGEQLSRPVVVEPVIGAGGTLGAERVAKAPADGYTLLLSGDAALTTNVTLMGNLAYDPLKSFAPIGLLVDSVNILVVHPSVAAKSVQELVALARSQPGRLMYASSGNGTSQHLGGELLRSMAGIDVIHVPYKGWAPLFPDLLAGRVQMNFANIAAVLPHIREGKLRALAVSSAKRVPMLPELPTVAESGYPGFEATAWVGLAAPAGTSDMIVRRLNEEARRAMTSPEIREKLGDLGLVILGGTPHEFRQQIRDEIPRKGKLVIESGAKAN